MMVERVDKRVPIPAYYQLKEIIRHKIVNKEWTPGDRIPSEKELGEVNHINRTTVRQAIMELCAEGLLYRAKGRGTFVARDKLERDLSDLNSVFLSLRASGHDIRVKVLKLDTIPASGTVSKKLNIQQDAKVIRLERLRFLDGKPFQLETSYIPFELCPELLHEDFTKDSLYFLLENTYGFTLHWAQMAIEAASADENNAKLLGVKRGFPLLSIEQVAYLEDGQAIQFLQASSRSDDYKYCFTRQRKKWARF